MTERSIRWPFFI